MLDFSTIEADRAARCAYWREKGVYADFTYAEAFAQGAERHPGARLTFHSAVRPASATVEEIFLATDRLAAAFHRLGLRPGDRLAVMLPTWLDVPLAYGAALKLGLAVIPIVAIYGARELGFIIRQTEAKALLVPHAWRGYDFLQKVADAGEMPSLRRLFVIGERRPAGAIDWDALRAETGVDYPRGEAQADDVACILYTSGTTSEPKGVKHTHNTQLCDLNAARLTPDAGAMSVGAPQGAGPALSVWPAGHIASYLSLMRPLLYGGDYIYMDQWVPEDAARLIERHKVSASVGTPIFLSTLLAAAKAVEADISSLRSFGLGASAITTENVRWTDEMGFPSGRSYGMTEHPVVSSCGSEEGFAIRGYTDGRITAHTEVRILDDEGCDLAIGEAGEIATRGSRLFMVYVDSELDRACFLPGGWFRTGDIGRLNADGYLSITDRKKDIIIRGGENISAKEVEDMLASIPGVIESAAVAMPDEALGERVCAFVILAPGANLTLGTLDAHFRRLGAARQKTPERLVLVPEMPRTPSGKVKKVELRARLRAGGDLFGGR